MWILPLDWVANLANHKTMYGLIACGFALCHRQNLLENPYTNPIGTGSKKFLKTMQPFS